MLLEQKGYSPYYKGTSRLPYLKCKGYTKTYGKATFIYRNSRIKPDDFVLRQTPLRALRSNQELGKLLGIPFGDRVSCNPKSLTVKRSLRPFASLTERRSHGSQCVSCNGKGKAKETEQSSSAKLKEMKGSGFQCQGKGRLI